MKLPFFKKKEPEILQKRGYVPVDRVRELAARGFSEPEMIDVLRKEGFSPEEIDKALTQSLKSDVTKEKVEEPKLPSGPEKTKPTLPTIEELLPEKKEPIQVPETSLPEYYGEYSTEDYVDAIVEARISEVNEKMREFAVKHQELETRLKEISSRLEKLVSDRRLEQQKILEKIEAFGESVDNINVRLGSVEKAFKETLPALIESVRALSDLVQRLKSEAR